MRPRLIVFSLMFLTLLLCAQSASAALLRYEPFDYDDIGTTVEGKTNPDGETWVAAYGNSVAPSLIKVSGGNLNTPPDISPPIGNSAQIKGGPSTVGTNPQQAGKSLRLPLGGGAAQNSGDSVFYSMALRIDELTGSTNVVGGFFMALNNSATATTTNPGAAAARLQGRIDPTDSSKYNLGIFRNVNAAAAATSWSGPLTVGETLFVVAQYETVPGDQNDIARLWINPDPSSFYQSPPAPTVIDNSTGVGSDIGIASILLRQSLAPHVTIDELRVGTDWKSVTIPEPAALTLLLIGCALFMSGPRKCSRV